MSDKKPTYFCYGPLYGYNEFNTLEEAREEAEFTIQHYMDNHPDNLWSEEVEETVIGIVLERATQINVVETPDGDYATTCDYEMKVEG